ncbi:aromatic ring-hydroxylating dioxygenase subunit alpha [Jatrophihabitans sp.]|uniref:aromatic ring-hydroxylating oxygenase subunit alpha n=1 Tax=Jatrophihabitans sp. TaxID=1932789 RepID=UPI0030C706A2|nr:hypothetical protein [Jatrophihabitans sp.]
MSTESEIGSVALDPDGRVAALIEDGRTLPSHWYTDPAIHKLEQRLVFRRAWQYVGHRGMVENVGDYFTCEVGGVPLVVVHSNDGVIRGLLNICRHRHHPVAVGSGNRSTFQCFYHAWTYKLDGTFHAAPRARKANFDGCGLALASVPVEFFGDMLFVNPSGDAPPLLDALAPIPELAKTRGYPIDSARFRATRHMNVSSNWKIFWDNNCECYHCPTVHSAWARTVNTDGEHIYSYPIGPFHFETFEDTTDSGVPDYIFFAWPALCMCTPGTGGKVEAGDVVDAAGGVVRNGFIMERLVPIGTDSCRMEYDVYAVDSVTDEQVEEWLDSAFSIVTEDREVCERLQHAHESGVGEPGTLITGIDSEYHTLVWQRLLYRALTEPETPLYAPLLERAATWPELDATAEGPS